MQVHFSPEFKALISTTCIVCCIIVLCLNGDGGGTAELLQNIGTRSYFLSLRTQKQSNVHIGIKGIKAIFDALLYGNFVNLKRDFLETHVGMPRHMIVFELCDTVVSFETKYLKWHTNCGTWPCIVKSY